MCKWISNKNSLFEENWICRNCEWKRFLLADKCADQQRSKVNIFTRFLILKWSLHFFSSFPLEQGLFPCQAEGSWHVINFQFCWATNLRHMVCLPGKDQEFKKKNQKLKIGLGICYFIHRHDWLFFSSTWCAHYSFHN